MPLRRATWCLLPEVPVMGAEPASALDLGHRRADCGRPTPTRRRTSVRWRSAARSAPPTTASCPPAIRPRGARSRRPCPDTPPASGSAPSADTTSEPAATRADAHRSEEQMQLMRGDQPLEPRTSGPADRGSPSTRYRRQASPPTTLDRTGGGSRCLATARATIGGGGLTSATPHVRRRPCSHQDPLALVGQVLEDQWCQPREHRIYKVVDISHVNVNDLGNPPSPPNVRQGR